MSVAEVKETKATLKAWIDEISDNNMLSLLDGVRTASSDKLSWDGLSEYQKENINAGLGDIEKGRVMSSQEFWKQLKNG
jgi:hypothetical protein